MINLAHLIGTEELAGYGFFGDGLFPTLTVKILTKKTIYCHLKNKICFFAGLLTK